MSNPEVQRIANELEHVGHALTTFELLGIRDFEIVAADLVEVIALNEQFTPEQAAERTGMVMCKDVRSKASGAKLVLPVLSTLFADRPHLLDGWDMYTVNHYETGDYFKPHQDYVDGTVVIATAVGRRALDVFVKEDDDVFNTVSATYDLVPGSVVILNGFMDLGHAARCVEGPSISVVGDVPERITRDV